MRDFYHKQKPLVLALLIIIAFSINTFVYQLNISLFVQSILFALIAFVFFDFIAEVTTKKEIFDNLIKLLKNNNDNINMGFQRVVLNAEKIDYKDLIHKSSNIYVCQIYGRQWLGIYKRAIIEKLRTDRNTKIYFIQYDTKNVTVKGYSSLFTNGDEEKLSRKIEEALDICKEIENEKPDQVKIIKVTDRPFFGAIYIFDNLLINIPLSMANKDFSNFIAYEFEKTENDNDGYRVFKSQVDELVGM